MQYLSNNITIGDAAHAVSSFFALGSSTQERQPAGLRSPKKG